jgi:hypothetical protein
LAIDSFLYYPAQVREFEIAMSSEMSGELNSCARLLSVRGRTTLAARL